MNTDEQRPLTIGVTGGIASGKSAVAQAFAALGIPWVDADDVAREVVAPGEPALAEIAERFGPEVLDAQGRLNRRALRAIVFADEGQRRWLESVTHPRIRQRLLERLEGMRASGAPYHLLVSPLLFESGQRELVDRCLVIDVPESLQMARTMQRDEVDEAQARAIIEAQMPRSKRLAMADDVIDNQGDRDALARQVAELDARYRGLATAHTSEQ
ncbi:dephospho-CoA kinase [Modicisalibacter ilicicola DSM 19980]|uniref:Dephospho-CoA kinase n=1 Tax=Modicisalibacter ilicicola DSM 19980 TaxID=1121942 RepID=A0A1M5C5M6_9GAMM|nr:dephospho-CoA kinase [Halomonas ilicicola]SHF49722.1 dephospho-CoA kinase [Halomonas ilicicola DSM 19980]